jgi:hypothetical protein
MKDDEEFIAQRQARDARRFLEAAVDPDVAPRLSPALIAIRKTLSADGPTAHVTVLAAGVRAGDLAVKTVDNVLRELMRAGMVRRVGSYTRTYDRRSRRYVAHDTRMYFLEDWS